MFFFTRFTALDETFESRPCKGAPIWSAPPGFVTFFTCALRSLLPLRVCPFSRKNTARSCRFRRFRLLHGSKRMNNVFPVPMSTEGSLFVRFHAVKKFPVGGELTSPYCFGSGNTRRILSDEFRDRKSRIPW